MSKIELVLFKRMDFLFGCLCWTEEGRFGASSLRFGAGWLRGLREGQPTGGNGTDRERRFADGETVHQIFKGYFFISCGHI